MGEISADSVHPFRAHLAVKRCGTTSALPGRYCARQDVWVIDCSDEPTPIVLAYSGEAGAPMTKVECERDQDRAPALLQLVTKTHQQLERDDQGPRSAGVLPELVTKTDEVRERDDPSSSVLLELATKTETRRERDD